MTESEIREEALRRYPEITEFESITDRDENIAMGIQRRSFINGGKFVLDALKDKNLLFKMIHDIEMEALNTKDDEL